MFLINPFGLSFETGHTHFSVYEYQLEACTVFENYLQPNTTKGHQTHEYDSDGKYIALDQTWDRISLSW